jgi:hypothetical protein
MIIKQWIRRDVGEGGYGLIKALSSYLPAEAEEDQEHLSQDDDRKMNPVSSE